MSNVFATPTPEEDNPFADFLAAPLAEPPVAASPAENPFADFLAPTPTPAAANVAPPTALDIGNVTTPGQPATRVPIGPAQPVQDNPFADFAAPVAPTDNPFAEFVAQPIAKNPAAAESFADEVAAGWQRSMAQPGVASAMDLIGVKIGSMDPAKWASEQAAMQRQVGQAPASSATSRLDPNWWAARLGETLPQIAEIGAWGLPGTIGGPYGAVAAASAAGGMLDMSNSFIDRLRSKGVDVTNEAALYMASQDPALFDDAFWYAARRAGTIAAVSAMTGVVASKVLPSVMPGAVIGATTDAAGASLALHAPRTLLQKTGQAAVGAGIGVASGGLEESAAQVASTGGIEDWWDVVDESLVGALASTPEVVAPAAGAAVHGPKGIFGRAPKAGPADAGPPAEPPMQYTVGPDGNVQLTDSRFASDTSNPDVAATVRIIRNIADAGQRVDNRTPTPQNQTASQWLDALNLDPSVGGMERRLSDYLEREYQINLTHTIPMARVMQEVADGLLTTNWERWRADPATSRALFGPLPGSMMKPLEITTPLSQSNIGLQSRGSRVDTGISVSGAGYSFHDFAITADDQTVGEIQISISPHNPTDVHVNWIIANGGRNPGRILGFRGTRKLLSLIKKEFPQSKTISGFRVSGARSATGSGAADAQMAFEQEPQTRLVTYPLPDDVRVVDLAEGRAENGQRVLVVSTDQTMSPTHVRKVIEHARLEGYQGIAFEADSELGAGIATQTNTTAEALNVDVLFGGRKALGVVALERETGVPVTVASEAATVTAAIAGEPYAEGRFTPEEVANFMARVNRIVQDFRQRFHFSQKIKINVVDNLPNGESARATYTFGGDEATISIQPDRAPTLAKLFNSVMHEFGHLVMYDKLYNADSRTQLAILQEYAVWREENRQQNEAGVPHRNTVLSRISPSEMSTIFNSRSRLPGLQYATDEEYWLSFDEWFAAQVARWATTQPRPLTVVDRFFNGLAKTLKRMLERFYRAAGLKFDPPIAVKTYLDAFLEEVNPGAFKSLYDQIEIETRLKNQAALRALGAPYVEAVGQTAATGPSREAIIKLFGGAGNKIVDPTTGAVTYRVEQNATYQRGRKKTTLEVMQGQAAIADKVFTLWTGGIGIYQLAQRNLHIPGLQRFKQYLQEADAYLKSIANRAVGTVKLSEKLSTEMTLKLHLALDDYGQMRYRSPREVNRGIKRHPTPDELTAIFDKHGLSDLARRVFAAQQSDYAFALDIVEQSARDEIGQSFAGLAPNERLLAQAKALQALDAEMAAMRKAPYIPQMRWGLHTVTVYGRDSNGEMKKILWFSQDETVKQQRRTAAELRELYPDAESNPIVESVLSEDIVPLMGIPRPLLQRLKDKAGFSRDQLKYIEDLAYELAPVHSFKHRMQTKENIAGYAKDFSRAYAAYFLQFANFMAKAKWGDLMREAVSEVQEQGRFMPDDTKSWQDWFGLYNPRGSKRGRIGNEMADHLRDWLDPKADFWFIKGASFFVALGYAPLAALVNLSGILTGSYGIMAEGFGDIAAGKHLGKAGARFARHRTKVDAPLADHQMMMRQILVEQGTIDESFAANLAGVAEGRNLLEQVSNKKVARGFYWFLEKSSLLFQYTEKTVRIVTADAAYMAALEQPTAKFVLDSIQSEQLLFDRLVTTGQMSPTQAAATVTAKRAVNNSQGIYSQWARPRYSRGKKGTLFQFKSFQQNLLWNLWNHKQGAVRSLLMFGLLGGLMAEPGAEDISDILKFLARIIFGKDFDLERDLRDTMTTWAHTDPGLFLHGVASKGFGIPSLLDLAGKIVGYNGIPFPETDLSAKLSVGNLSPIPLSIFLTPTDNPDEAIGKVAERASGAAWGLGFTLYRALTDVKNQDHWLRLVPAAVRNVPKAWEAFQTGELRDPYGGAIIKFDTRDTEQMMEILSYALGASPSRLVLEQAADRETREVIQFWDLRQQALLRQLSEAVKSDDREERESVIQSIKDFNQSLPETLKSKRITASAARESVQQRLRREEMRERNIPSRRQDRPVADRIHKLYFPEAEEVQTLPR